MLETGIIIGVYLAFASVIFLTFYSFFWVADGQPPYGSEAQEMAGAAMGLGIPCAFVYGGLVWMGITIGPASPTAGYVAVQEITNIDSVRARRHWMDDDLKKLMFYRASNLGGWDDVHEVAEITMPKELAKRIEAAHRTNDYENVTYVVTKRNGDVLSCYVKEP